MEDHKDDIGNGVGASPHEPAHDREVEKRPTPAEYVRRPSFTQQRPDQRQTSVVLQPDSERLRLQQPVGVQLGDAREDVYRSQLSPEQP